MKIIMVIMIITIHIGMSGAETAQNQSLEWTEKNIHLLAKAEEDGGVVRYHFKNVSKNTVHFKSVDPSCSCVVISRDKNDYGPGESGIIAASLDYTLITSSKHYSIKCLVETGANPIQSYNLDLTVDSAAPITLGNSSFAWIADSPKEAKSTPITIGHQVEIDKMTISGDEENVFNCRITKDKFNNYNLILCPRTTHMKELLPHWDGKDLFCELIKVNVAMKSGHIRWLPILATIGPNP